MSLDLDLSRYQLGWSDAEDYVFKPKRDLSAVSYTHLTLPTICSV